MESNVTMWEFARAAPLALIAAIGAWFVLLNQTGDGFVVALGYAAILSIAYGVITAMEWIALRM